MDSWAMCVFVAVLSLGGSADEESICSRVRDVRQQNGLPIPPDADELTLGMLVSQREAFVQVLAQPATWRLRRSGRVVGQA